MNLLPPPRLNPRWWNPHWRKSSGVHARAPCCRRPNPPCLLCMPPRGLPTSGQWKCDPRVVDVDGDGTQEIVALPRLLKGARMFLMQDGLWQDASAGLVTGSPWWRLGSAGFERRRPQRLDLRLPARASSHGFATKKVVGTRGRKPCGPSTCPMTRPTISCSKVSKTSPWVMSMGMATSTCSPGGSDEGGINMFLGDGTGVNWEWVSRRIAAQAGMVHPVDAARL